MANLRAYPQITNVEPTDALLIDRLGVGTVYIEEENFGIWGSGLVYQNIGNVSGDIVIDCSLGFNVEGVVVGNITSITLINFPPALYWRVVLTLTIGGVGNYVVTTWPAYNYVGAGFTPTLTTLVGFADKFVIDAYGNATPTLTSAGQALTLQA